MIRQVLLITGLAAASQAGAESLPLILLDQPACQVKGWHDIGGCFQNTTGSVIKKSDLYLREYIEFTDKRAPIFGLFPVDKLRADRYVVISTSTRILENNHIRKVRGELISGYHTNGGEIPGCTFELSRQNLLPVVKLVKSGDQLSCIPA